MYQFWYWYLKRKVTNQYRLLCTSTVSFLFEVQMGDFYNAHYFDFSDYPKAHELFAID